MNERLDWPVECRELADENARLRAALAAIADEPREPGNKLAYKLRAIACTVISTTPPLLTLYVKHPDGTYSEYGSLGAAIAKAQP